MLPDRNRPFTHSDYRFLYEKNENILPVEESVIKYKQKKIREQMRNNTKSHQGFGYAYKPLQFNLNK